MKFAIKGRNSAYSARFHPADRAKRSSERLAKGSRRTHYGESGFTLAEVLAALVFMAIVIPVSVQGLRIASLAGEVAQRKSQAMRVAERLLCESLVVTNGSLSSQGGTVTEGTREFRWNLRLVPWDQTGTNQVLSGASRSGGLISTQPEVNQFLANQVSMNIVSVEVFYQAQEREYSVRLNTLIPSQ